MFSQKNASLLNETCPFVLKSDELLLGMVLFTSGVERTGYSQEAWKMDGGVVGKTAGRLSGDRFLALLGFGEIASDIDHCITSHQLSSWFGTSRPKQHDEGENLVT